MNVLDAVVQKGGRIIAHEVKKWQPHRAFVVPSFASFLHSLFPTLWAIAWLVSPQPDLVITSLRSQR
eukprot:10353560-Prorocentrum_lima.AAC.1